MRVFYATANFMKPEEHLANITDLDFISSCILYGARKGHYSFDADKPAVVVAMKKEIKSVIMVQALLDQRYAQATVFRLNGERIAALIMSEAAPGHAGLEIYALSVAKKYQNRGYGGLILDAVLSRLVHTDVYARCSLFSEKMNSLLERRDFRIYGMDREFRVLLREAAASSEIAELMTMSNLSQYYAAPAE
jgi:ribosomal protein S18 acetylase RimI-like enzyme